MNKPKINIANLRSDIFQAQQEALEKLPRPPFSSIQVEFDGCQDYMGGLRVEEGLSLNYEEALRFYKWMTEVYGKDTP